MQDVFQQKLDAFKESETYSNLETQGGYYSFADMRKAVSEGGLGFSESIVCIFGEDKGSDSEGISACNLVCILKEEGEEGLRKGRGERTYPVPRPPQNSL